MPALLRRLLAIAILCLGGGAAPAPLAAAPCDDAIAAAAQREGLPPHLLQAIAEVESGRPDRASGRLEPWPWTVDANGQGAFFATEAQAIAAVRDLQAQGVRSIDVGCTQINLMFHPHAFASLSDAFDPRANARYAARFLKALHDRSGDWLQAIADYHSQTEVLGEDYRRRVLALWQNPAANWHLGLAVAYRDFLPPDRVYADFAPTSTVYGAFAKPSLPATEALRR